MREQGIPVLNKREAYYDITNEQIENFVFSTKLKDEDALDINIDYANESIRQNVITQPIIHHGITDKSKHNFNNLSKFNELLNKNPELKNRFTNLSKIPIVYIGKTQDTLIDAEVCDIGLGYLSQNMEVTTILCENKDKEVLLNELKYFPFSIKLACVNNLRQFNDDYIPAFSSLQDRISVVKLLA
ncbi:MAG: hypothetical protein RLZZ210_1250 [Pseudomonadota bacterium]|jgi:hypothetical protein